MIKDVTKSSSDIYRQRFVDYGTIYSESWPDPPPAPLPTNAALGAQKTVLTRKVRYNDKSTTQKTSVTGDKSNASNSN